MPTEDRLTTLRAALEQQPGDWQTALALKAALAEAGQYAEADAVFRRARRGFPDDLWAAHMASLYAFPQGELPELAARASLLASARPGEPGLHRLLGDMLLQARDYAAAAAAYARDPASEAYGRARDAARCAALAQLVRRAPESGCQPSIAIINLDRNTERLADMEGRFRCCSPPQFRIPGVEGSRLSSAAVGRLGGDPQMRGTLGCFLSHAAAWEAVLARGLQHCLIVEDDVIPLFDLPAHWGVFGIPAVFDLCFVNNRLAPRGGHSSFGAVQLADAMLEFPADANAPGADGYLLSASGARKLLGWVAQDGFAGDVDWRLLAYGLTAAQSSALPAGSHARAVLTKLTPLLASSDRLDAFVLAPPLIRTVPLASDREDENRAGAGRPSFPGPTDPA